MNCIPILPTFINDEAFQVLLRFYEDRPAEIAKLYYYPDEVAMVPIDTVFPFPLLSDDP